MEKEKNMNYNGNITFEGEYLKGKRWNGKGYNKTRNIEFELKNGNGEVKVYYGKGELKFEGEYLKGERFIGKQYNRFSKLEFEGEYLKGKKWNGKFFNKDGNIEFELKNGK